MDFIEFSWFHGFTAEDEKKACDRMINITNIGSQAKEMCYYVYKLN